MKLILTGILGNENSYHALKYLHLECTYHFGTLAFSRNRTYVHKLSFVISHSSLYYTGIWVCETWPRFLCRKIRWMNETLFYCQNLLLSSGQVVGHQFWNAQRKSWTGNFATKKTLIAKGNSMQWWWFNSGKNPWKNTIGVNSALETNNHSITLKKMKMATSCIYDPSAL